VKLRGRRKSDAGSVVLVESEDGVVVVVEAWMLDSIVCAGMAVGSPRASVAALLELQRLLMEFGFRGNLSRDSRISRTRPP
jgi:hypothetical protein